MKTNFKLHFSCKGIKDLAEGAHIVGDLEASVEHTPDEFLKMIAAYEPIIRTIMKSESTDKMFQSAPLGI